MEKLEMDEVLKKAEVLIEALPYIQKFNRKIIALVIAMVVGILVCYAFGTPWFMFVTNMDLVTSLGYCVIPFLIPDAVKIIVATVLVNRLNKIVKL